MQSLAPHRNTPAGRACVTLLATLLAAAAAAQVPPPANPLPPAPAAASPAPGGVPAAPAPTAAAPTTTAAPTAPAPGSSPAGVTSTAPAATTGPEALAALGWLRGCWHGTVNQREFREQWLPAAGGMMVGANHTVMQGRTQDYGYLRLEVRADGVFYVDTPSGDPASTFRLTAVSRDPLDGADIFTFANLAEGFPQRLTYRHASEGWLYAQVEGQPGVDARKVVYPMRHVDCGSDEVLHK